MKVFVLTELKSTGIPTSVTVFLLDFNWQETLVGLYLLAFKERLFFKGSRSHCLIFPCGWWEGLLSWSPSQQGFLCPRISPQGVLGFCLALIHSASEAVCSVLLPHTNAFFSSEGDGSSIPKMGKFVGLPRRAYWRARERATLQGKNFFPNKNWIFSKVRATLFFLFFWSPYLSFIVTWSQAW